MSADKQPTDDNSFLGSSSSNIPIFLVFSFHLFLLVRKSN